MLALFGDDPFHEQAVGRDRHVEHDDVARCRFSDAVRQTIDKQPILVGQRRRHAVALDAGQLHGEPHDECHAGAGDKGIARQGLRPRRDGGGAGAGSKGGSEAHVAKGWRPARADMASEGWPGDSAKRLPGASLLRAITIAGER